MSGIGNFFSGLFGGGSNKINYTPPNFNAGGISATFGGGGYNLGVDPSRTATVGQLASTFGQQASALGTLGATVQPGFSQFRQAGLADINAGKQSTLSTLQQNLAQRKILGSSFAQDALSRSAAEYDKQKADFEAQSYLQELQASNQIIQQQYTAATNQFKVGLDELNLEAGIGAQLTGQVSGAMAQVAQAQAYLDAQNASGIGKFFGGILGLGTGGGNTLGGSAISGIGSGISSLASGAADLFGGGAAASGAAAAGMFL